ncbi:PAS domain S-box protein [Methanoregula sp.]|jgi:PAS domain S-box-containing protein|uniref:PAS domain S-box protein n=1 Tax=Methanoregula sp. TaxID=2052170 RepID=UPI003C1A00CC
MDRNVRIGDYSITHTDIVRICVILSLTLSCIFITSISLSRHVETIYAQLFYFPILYATYFFPKRGLYLAGFCAIVYEVLAYIYVFPDTGGLIFTTGQAILFIGIAAVVAYFTEKINQSEARYRSIFETSLLGIILFDQNSFAIRMTNSHLAQMLGFPEEELGKMTFSQLFFAKDGQRRFFEYLGSSEDVVNFETLFVAKDRRPVWVNLSWSRIDDNLVSCSVIDIDQRKQAEQAAEENYTQYKQVTENAPTCIIILAHNRIVYANPTFRAFTGYEPGELMGNDLRPIIHPEDRDRFPVFPDAPDPRQPLPGMTELRFLTKSGDTRLGTLFFTWILQKGSHAVLINLVDITEHEKLKVTIQQDNERRRGIISTVAHELRTPLQPIMGYLNLLTQDPEAYGVTDETKAILDRCAKSVDRERQIINQMLELSVLDSGKIPLKSSIFNVPDMLKTIIEAGGYTTKADISMDVPPGLRFDADENKISIVIDSMLSNAVNYSKPPRKIRIAYLSNAQEKMHRLAIQDNGVGITNSQLDEIFEPFQLPDSGNVSRKYDRIGLSLSIAKKYIRMHGGFISVDSVVNIGSTFTIHIPKQRQHEEKV